MICADFLNANFTSGWDSSEVENVHVIGFYQTSPSHIISTKQVESVKKNLKILLVFVQLQLIFQEADDSKIYRLPL